MAGFGYLALLFPFGGALTGHTAFGVVANAATLADKLELSALGLLVLILLALLARRRPLSAVRP
ncbi:hypothetical protein ACFFR3_48865 [Nonomuraea salmonea]|uniref:Uncharacterized protein n=1 Tax=Nonomuraea salmonea TaxID=46181 RepID=A0ABV5P4G5_9ACTN